jgi:hypothetical protein
MQPHATIWKHLMTVMAAALVVMAEQEAAAVQWPDYASATIPRTAAGKPDLSAKVRRTPDGKPDLSGIWQSESDPATHRASDCCRTRI